ncbi:MAG TPA: ATP-binding protein [Bryobacteraceae bacterium]|nr:ATP-binding protein [Bryobacteraceae bacterium]
MREGLTGRLVAIGAVFFVALSSSALWLQSNVIPGNYLTFFSKLLLANLLACSVSLVLVLRLARRWRVAADRLESFAAALPATEIALPENEPGELGGLARALREMAERVRHVMERATSELSRREAILACMAEGVLAVDQNLRVIFCNEAFARAFSARMPVAEGRILYEVVREPVIRDILERVVKTGAAETDRFQLPSAAGRWFEARALPFGEQPRRGGVIVLHDVTDIERQEQVRKDFVADVSHELRTPLAAIRGYAETLLDGALEDQANNRKFVEIIQSHAIRLNNIASDLLVISELDRNAPPEMPPERVSLLSVVQSAMHTVEAQAVMRGIRVEIGCCQDCTVIGYRFRLEQAVTNLLDNAVKFNRENGLVTVECAPAADGRVRLSIADSGMGIPSEDLKRVFERFYRVDKARSRPSGGTGLGLPIVKEVVERMGGSVAVESQLGRGSKFTILLKSA